MSTNTSINTYFNLLWTWLIARDKPRHHWRRYILGSSVSILCIIVIATAYMVLTPPCYRSEWKIILPVSGVHSNFSLERIGQAQQRAHSPFADKYLSPKVNYKEIALSRPVLHAAAQKLHQKASVFSSLNIKLIDQTAIIEFAVDASSPDQAQALAFAHLTTLKSKLTSLRNDEIRRRNTAIRGALEKVEDNLKTARDRLIALQSKTGLASIDQYNQIVSSIETLHRDRSVALTQLAELESQNLMLSKTLNIHPRELGALVNLSADPEFRRLWESYAAASALRAENLKRFGPNHPRLREPMQKLTSIESALNTLLRAKNIDVTTIKARNLLSLYDENIKELLTKYVSKSVALAGFKARVRKIDTLLTTLEQRRSSLSTIAARLDDLQRDHQVANAVFSSAIARIDSTRSDVYASYPLVQILEQPTLPKKPHSPHLLFAVLGALVAAVFAIATWVFAWLHQWFAFIRLTKRSYSMRYA